MTLDLHLASSDAFSRRALLQLGAAGAVGLSMGGSSVQQALAASTGGGGRAKSVILLFTWGGISHIDCWDLKPNAGSDIRGEFQPISTTVPGLQIGEHLPMLAQRMHHVALVRSAHHKSADHRKGAYWSLTGHPPTNSMGGVVAPELPSRKDWPCLGSQVAKALYRKRSTEELSRAAAPADTDPDATGKPEPELLDLKVIKSVSLSTDVLGPGRFPVGSFNHQDGYTNNTTVELIGMISAAAQDDCPLTRQADGPSGDFNGCVAGDSTAGDWGSDTHGRGGNLYLPGGGEPDVPHVGFGGHANKFITFDLQAVRRKHFGGRDGHLQLTGFVGVNGAPGVPAKAAIQGGVWIDGVQRDISPEIPRNAAPHEFTVYVHAESRWLTLAMLNGPQSTWYDDIAFRDVKLALVAGDIPADRFRPAGGEQELEPTQMTNAVAAALPGTISIPYPLSDRGLLNGQYGGFLGADFDPVFVKPRKARQYKGVSQLSGHVDLRLAGGITNSRIRERRDLLNSLQSPSITAGHFGGGHDFKREQALNMLMSPAVKDAFDLRREPRALRETYGDHVCGQSVLMARRLAEAGVPFITVNCSAGDLNSGQGDHFDTHQNNFNRLKQDLLPPYDRAASALLDDLAQRGRQQDILVISIGDFGRTPTINSNAGRDHFPNCFSMWFAGGGIRGGQVYGSSDGTASEPLDNPCGPEDIHATVFHALGIDPHFTVYDLEDRPLPLTDGQPLPLFG